MPCGWTCAGTPALPTYPPDAQQNNGLCLFTCIANAVGRATHDTRVVRPGVGAFSAAAPTPTPSLRTYRRFAPLRGHAGGTRCAAPRHSGWATDGTSGRRTQRDTGSQRHYTRRATQPSTTSCIVLLFLSPVPDFYLLPGANRCADRLIAHCAVGVWNFRAWTGRLSAAAQTNTDARHLTAAGTLHLPRRHIRSPTRTQNSTALAARYSFSHSLERFIVSGSDVGTVRAYDLPFLLRAPRQRGATCLDTAASAWVLSSHLTSLPGNTCGRDGTTSSSVPPMHYRRALM